LLLKLPMHVLDDYSCCWEIYRAQMTEMHTQQRSVANAFG
jgi:hypothetical protein